MMTNQWYRVPYHYMLNHKRISASRKSDWLGDTTRYPRMPKVVGITCNCFVENLWIREKNLDCDIKQCSKVNLLGQYERIFPIKAGSCEDMILSWRKLSSLGSLLVQIGAKTPRLTILFSCAGKPQNDGSLRRCQI